MKKKAAATVKKRVPKIPATSAVVAVHSLALPPTETALVAVRKATLSEKWMIAAFRIDGGTMTLDRVAMNFPKEDVGLACRLFVEDTEKLKSE